MALHELYKYINKYYDQVGRTLGPDPCRGPPGTEQAGEALCGTGPWDWLCSSLSSGYLLSTAGIPDTGAGPLGHLPGPGSGVGDVLGGTHNCPSAPTSPWPASLPESTVAVCHARPPLWDARAAREEGPAMVGTGTTSQ